MTWEHLLDNFMQSIYAGFLCFSYTTGKVGTSCVKMMSDDDTDDCDGLFDRLF